VISFDCPSCRKKLQVKDEFAGRDGKCPSCGDTMKIPDNSQAPERDFYASTVIEEEEMPARPGSAPSRRQNAAVEPEPLQTSQEIHNHGNGQLHAWDDFFMPPPAEIGEVVSAYTSLRKDTLPMSPGTRIAGVMVAGTVGLAIGLVISLNIKNPFFQLFWPVLLASSGLLVVLLATRFKHTCTYVAQEGVARFTCKGSREQVIGQVFCFKDAAELRTSQTRHYTNNVYQHTQYTYTWTDIGGRTRFVISGQHGSEAGTPPAKDAYHFATAAEKSWTIYLVGQVQAQLKMSGTVFFGLGGRNWVKLGERYISVHMSGVTTECDADDIAEVRIDQGWVQVRRVDAREGWFSSTGIFKFPYGSLANAHLFLILMDNLVGVRIN
jgi:hypothetical protein